MSLYINNKSYKIINHKIIILSAFLLTSRICFSNEPVIDSDLTFEDAIKESKAPKEILDSLCLLNVEYYSFDGKLHRGQIVINVNIKEDLVTIFELIKTLKFPINKCIPIVKYNWSDDASMLDNNTSAFCYRFVAGTTRLSNHALGRAIDINPFLNPVIYSDGKISPAGAKRDINLSGTFTDNNPIVVAFKNRGWRWGGNFDSFKDYHHFDKK